MHPRLFLRRTLVATTLALTFAFTACSSSSPSTSSAPSQPSATPPVSAHARARAREQQLEQCAQQLDAIPPPAKSRYMAIAASTHWQNPFLTIQQNTVELRVPAPAPPPVKRSRRSRRRSHKRSGPTAPLWTTTSLTLDTLPTALAALPESNWPYGRVIAIRDDLAGPSAARVAVRRNEEKILNLLNNLGVITYEWPLNSKR